MANQASLAKLLGRAVLCGLLAWGVALRAADEPPATSRGEAKPQGTRLESVETTDLHNAHRVTEKIVSGAAPETERAFEDLKALGVQTIISVDGAKPDAETAKRHGMRYVHLPIGYDEVGDAEGRNIAKALSELPGPIYLHCHHGKHRSAAAVAAACVMNGSLQPGQAESVLETFGTGANYKGLWKSARDARPLAAGELAAVEVEYVERARVPEPAERMVALDETWERLKAMRKNDWRAPADHPDLDAAHEALQLREHLHETGRAGDAAGRPAAYRELLAKGEAGASALREALAAKPPVDPRAAETAFDAVGSSCIACHKAYRD